MSKDKLIPEFRFPTFKNEGEWEEKVVSQLAKYENGKAHEQDINEEGKYVVVNSKFISSNGLKFKKSSGGVKFLFLKKTMNLVLSLCKASLLY